jgi:histidinol-phosphate aminotransferase
MSKVFDDIVQNAISERNRLSAALEREGSRLNFRVKTSQANFMLLRWPHTEASDRAYRHLMGAGILVRNVSGAPGLGGCLRLSVGTQAENNKLIAAFLSM